MSKTESAAVRADPDRRRWSRVALWLVCGTMAYNAVEAGIAVFAGVRAGSVALVGFGLDSVIEFTAGALVLWRLRLETAGQEPDRVERAEAAVERAVGVTFFGLAAYVVGYAAWILFSAEAPSESVLGIALAAASLVLMPLIAWGKLRAAHHLQSGSLRAEAKETLDLRLPLLLSPPGPPGQRPVGLLVGRSRRRPPHGPLARAGREGGVGRRTTRVTIPSPSRGSSWTDLPRYGGGDAGRRVAGH